MLPLFMSPLLMSPLFMWPFCAFRLTPKRLAIVFAALTISNSAWAENSELDLNQWLPQSCLLSGDFSQEKQLAAVPGPLQSSGQMIFDCQQGLIWNTQEPVAETLIYKLDGKHQRFIDNSEPERLSGRAHRELGKMLNHIIGADVDYLNQHFQTSPIDHGVQLVPKSKRMRKHLPSIDITQQNDRVQMLLRHAEGESTRIAIHNTRELTELNQTLCQQQWPQLHNACAALLP